MDIVDVCVEGVVVAAVDATAAATAVAVATLIAVIPIVDLCVFVVFGLQNTS